MKYHGRFSWAFLGAPAKVGINVVVISEEFVFLRSKMYLTLQKLLESEKSPSHK